MCESEKVQHAAPDKGKKKKDDKKKAGQAQTGKVSGHNGGVGVWQSCSNFVLATCSYQWALSSPKLSTVI